MSEVFAEYSHYYDLLYADKNYDAEAQYMAGPRSPGWWNAWARQLTVPRFWPLTNSEVKERNG